MSNKLKIVVDEIRTTIKQTFDDKDVSRQQVAYWVIAVGNKLLGQHIIKRDSGAFLVPYIVDVEQEESGSKFITIPVSIFDFDLDGGIEYMSYFRGDAIKPEYRNKTFTRASPSELQWFELHKNTRPTPKNPCYWRAGEKVYLEGLEGTPVKKIEFGVYQTINPLEKADLNAPFNFPDELLESLKRTVTDLARFSFLFPSDSSNDGTDTASQPAGKAIPKIASVNNQDNG